MGKFEKFLFGAVMVFCVFLLLLPPVYMGYREVTGADDAEVAAREKADREGPCIDKVVMLATTAGSPNQVDCPNVRHYSRYGFDAEWRGSCRYSAL